MATKAVRPGPETVFVRNQRYQAGVPITTPKRRRKGNGSKSASSRLPQLTLWLSPKQNGG